MSARYLGVAVDAPLRRIFDYRVPGSLPEHGLVRGQRVHVPFGRRRLTGVLVEIRDATRLDADKVKPAHGVIDATPVFDECLLDLLIWASEYYHHPVGEVVTGALPAALRSGAPLNAQTPAWRLTLAGRSVDPARLPANATRLRALLRALADVPFLTAEQLGSVTRDFRQGLRSLESRGWTESFTLVSSTASGRSRPRALTGPALSAEQAAAVDAIVGNFGRYANLVLHGVTGSGKTEVYLRAIATALERDLQALVLVPEIALTPQLVRRFAERFGESPALLHSGLTDAERLEGWRAAREGRAAIVIGTRSAIFTPLARPGLLVVDEEHDPSFKQQDGFRYSARDLAIARAQRHGIPVVLGSATPSLESLARVDRGEARMLTLPTRAGGARAPRVSLIDLRRHGEREGLATPSLLAIRRHLDADGQVLLFLNRRGYAPVLFCRECGWAAPCPRCDARLTVHRRSPRLICHHCGHEDRIPERCPQCAAAARPVGQGTERIEETLGALFPEASVARIDRDAVRRRGELEDALDRVDAGAVRILVGTQMLTKGHHFPRVTLVVVINADQGLYSADFRASERLAQTIVQVAGRAGRAERPGEVLIQTSYPEHPLLADLLAGGYEAFARTALAERAGSGWPPFARLALFRAEAPRPEVARSFLEQIGALCLSHSAPDVEVLGPASAPMERRAGRFRAQLLLRSPHARALQRTLRRVVPLVEELREARRVRWAIDVDPLDLF